MYKVLYIFYTCRTLHAIPWTCVMYKMGPIYAPCEMPAIHSAYRQSIPHFDCHHIPVLVSQIYIIQCNRTSEISEKERRGYT